MRNKMIFVATIPGFFDFFKGQLAHLNTHFDVCLVASPEQKLKDIAKREGVKSYSIKIKREVSLHNDLLSLYKLIRFFRKEAPLIVHGNTPKGAFLSVLAAYFSRVPVRIYYCHGLRYQGIKKGFLKKVLMKIEKLTCKLSTNIYCVGEGVKSSLISDGIARENKLKVILYGSPNGLDFELFQKTKTFDVLKFKQYLGVNSKDFVFLFVGRIVKDKGVNELINAFEQLQKEDKNISLILVGPIEPNNLLTDYTLRRIKKNNKIYHVGTVIDVKPYMEISDTLVLPSYREGFGVVLLEAAAMNLPVIVSNISGCNNIVIENINGIFVKPRDYEDLFHQMRRLLIDVELRKSIVRNTRKVVIEKFNQKAVWNVALNEYKFLEKSSNLKNYK